MADVTAQTVIDALRLAREGAADDDAFVSMARLLLDEAPVSDVHGTEGPALLVDLIRDGYVQTIVVAQ